MLRRGPPSRENKEIMSLFEKRERKRRDKRPLRGRGSREGSRWWDKNKEKLKRR